MTDWVLGLAPTLKLGITLLAIVTLMRCRLSMGLALLVGAVFLGVLFPMPLADFLRSAGGLGYASVEDFLKSIRWRIGDLSAREEKRLRTLYRGLPREADGSARYRHVFNWAMLSWETGSQ